MMRDNFEEHIIFKLIDKHFPGYKNINMETNLIKDFNADSLDIADFVMDIEEAFQIEFSDPDKLQTIGDFVESIQKLRK